MFQFVFNGDIGVNWAEWFSAFGSIFAAGVALWLAKKNNHKIELMVSPQYTRGHNDKGKWDTTNVHLNLSFHNMTHHKFSLRGSVRLYSVGFKENIEVYISAFHFAKESEGAFEIDPFQTKERLLPVYPKIFTSLIFINNLKPSQLKNIPSFLRNICLWLFYKKGFKVFYVQGPQFKVKAKCRLDDGKITLDRNLTAESFYTLLKSQERFNFSELNPTEETPHGQA